MQIFCLARNDAAQKRGNFRIVLGKKKIGPDLGACVAQPFGGNIARLDIGRTVGSDRCLPAGVEQRGTIHGLQPFVWIVKRLSGSRNSRQFQRGSDRWSKQNPQQHYG